MALFVIATDCHVQVMDQTALQDTDTVVAIVMQSLVDFKKANPEVEEVILKSDNAGCYHCSNTIVRLWALRNSVPGLKVLGIHFGEPGKGKGPCDKYFAIIPAQQRRCIKDQYNADTPKDFAENMCRYGGIANKPFNWAQ